MVQQYSFRYNYGLVEFRWLLSIHGSDTPLEYGSVFNTISFPRILRHCYVIFTDVPFSVINAPLLALRFRHNPASQAVSFLEAIVRNLKTRLIDLIAISNRCKLPMTLFVVSDLVMSFEYSSTRELLLES
jgi:hypothetical protein